MSDDVTRLWQTPEEDSRDEWPDDVVLMRVRGRAAELDRTIQRRDRLEILAAALASVLFMPLLFDASWVTRAGVVLFLVGAGLVVVKLRRARRNPPDPAAPLGQVLRLERDRIDQQVRMLESALWWYITPLCLGVILIFVGSTGLSWASLAYTAAVAALGIWIWKLNRNAARRELAPQRDELDRLLEQLEDDAP